jgi:crotonobetainyl-CoA:carnitine CoA-transferase CaiB-like acyl-CoA transferase
MLMLMFPIVGTDAKGAWTALCKHGGQEWMATDARFQEPGLSMNGSSDEDVQAIRDGCAEIFAARSLDEWHAFFRTQPDFVWSPVNDHHQALKDEQALANGYVVSVQLPHLEHPSVSVLSTGRVEIMGWIMIRTD